MSRTKVYDCHPAPRGTSHAYEVSYQAELDQSRPGVRVIVPGHISREEAIAQMRVVMSRVASTHRSDVEAAADRAKLASDAPCPACGSQLQLKKGKFGLFVGCTGYPTCRYTETFNEEDARGAESR